MYLFAHFNANVGTKLCLHCGHLNEKPQNVNIYFGKIIFMSIYILLSTKDALVDTPNPRVILCHTQRANTLLLPPAGPAGVAVERSET